jgi:hypothetical protein
MDPGIVARKATFRGADIIVAGVLCDIETEPLGIVPRLPAGSEQYFLISGVESFEAIRYGGRNLAERGEIADEACWYRYDPKKKRVEIKVEVLKGAGNRLVLR